MATLYVNNTGQTYTDPDGNIWGVGNDTTGNGSFTAPYATITKALTIVVTNDTLILSPSTFVSGVDFAVTGFSFHNKDNVTFRGADPANKSVLNGSGMGASAGGTAGTSMIYLSSGMNCKYIEFNEVAAGAAKEYSTSYWHYAVGAVGTITSPINISYCSFTKNYRAINLNGAEATDWVIDRCLFDENLDKVIHAGSVVSGSVIVALITRCVFSGLLIPGVRTVCNIQGVYAENINAGNSLTLYNNTFAGISFPIISTNGYTGVLIIKNNVFYGTSLGYSISKGTATTLTEGNNAWCGSKPSTHFASIAQNFTPDTSDLSDYAHAKTARYKGWYVLRFDDRPSTSTPAKDSYYTDAGTVLYNHGLKGSYAFDVAGLTAQDITTALALIAQGHEISCHSYSHMSMNNASGSANNIPFSVTGPVGSNITITRSGTAPLDITTITLTEGVTSTQITYPAVSELLYNMTDDPTVYSVVETGTVQGSVVANFDLGSLKGLRDYIDSLTNWSATAYNAGEYDHAELTLARNIAAINQDNPSSTALPWDTVPLHWWEMRYPKLVLENLLSVTVNTFTYPNYKYDSLAKTDLLLHGYSVGLGEMIVSDADAYDAGYAVMFNIITTLLYYYRLLSNDVLQDRFESVAEIIGNGHKIFSLMAHVAADFSVAQWEVLASTLAGYSDRAVCVTGNELGELISSSPLWSTADGGLTYRRTDWTEFSGNYHLPVTSPCVGSGADVGITTDIDGNQLYSPYNIGSYSGDGSDMQMASIAYPGPLGLDAPVTVGTVYPDITITAPLGAEMQAVTPFTAGAAVNLATLVPSAKVRIGTKGMLVYDTDLTAAEIVRADKIVGA